MSFTGPSDSQIIDADGSTNYKTRDAIIKESIIAILDLPLPKRNMIREQTPATHLKSFDYWKYCSYKIQIVHYLGPKLPARSKLGYPPKKEQYSHTTLTRQNPQH
jgi:hypothetical protein